jgi:hypothetical protein
MENLNLGPNGEVIRTFFENGFDGEVYKITWDYERPYEIGIYYQIHDIYSKYQRGDNFTSMVKAHVALEEQYTINPRIQTIEILKQEYKRKSVLLLGSTFYRINRVVSVIPPKVLSKDQLIEWIFDYLSDMYS